ncbi:MAG: hypothetical protein IPI67_23905 [Myxococcales bacterium]|nr:hypothetical protein [Myxococcales bacterium]
MLEMVAWRADTLGLDDAQKIALGDGLLQAVAFARDPRAGPVLEAVFTRAQDARFVGSAAAGLGMLCRARDRALLLSHVRAGEPRRAEAIAGLGHCRSLDVAERLASVLAEPIDDALAVTTARALGYVGSSWAIAASRLDAKQADAIREAAATALARGFSRGNAQLRTAIARAVLMVEHPAALPALRRAERGAPSDVRKDASALRGRLELNIARSSRR